MCNDARLKCSLCFFAAWQGLYCESGVYIGPHSVPWVAELTHYPPSILTEFSTLDYIDTFNNTFIKINYICSRTNFTCVHLCVCSLAFLYLYFTSFIRTRRYPAAYVVFYIWKCTPEDSCDILESIDNLLNNKTIILLNLAEYHLMLANSAYGLVGYIFKAKRRPQFAKLSNVKVIFLTLKYIAGLFKKYISLQLKIFC